MQSYSFGSQSTLRLEHECQSLDPVRTNHANCHRLITDIYEGLVRIGPDGSPQPGVAKSWHWRNSNTLVFELKNDRKWSDGTPVTADDFILAWRRILTSTKFRNPMYRALKKVSGSAACKQYSDERCATGLTAETPNTLVVHFNKVDQLFQLRTLNATLMPVPSAFVKKHGDSWWEHNDRPFNGAYKINNMPAISQQSIENTPLELVPNPHHPEIGTVNIQSAIYLPKKAYDQKLPIRVHFEDPETSDVKYHLTNIQDDVKKFLVKNNWKIIPRNDINTIMLLLNVDSLEPSLIEAIKLLTYAFELESRIIGSSASPVQRLFNHHTALTPFNNNLAENTPHENIEKAKALLKKLSISLQNQFTLRIGIVHQNPFIIRNLDILKNLFKEQGIHLDLKFYNNEKERSKAARNGAIDSYIANWYVSLPHPSGFFLILDWAPFPLLKDEQRLVLNQILEKYTDDNKFPSLYAYHKAEEHLINSGGFLPFVTQKYYVVYRSHLCGITGNTSLTSPLLWIRFCE